jgi:hypothetical protein
MEDVLNFHPPGAGGLECRIRIIPWVEPFNPSWESAAKRCGHFPAGSTFQRSKLLRSRRE